MVTGQPTSIFIFLYPMFSIHVLHPVALNCAVKYAGLLQEATLQVALKLEVAVKIGSPN